MMEWDSATAVISYDRYTKTGWISIDVEEDSRWKVIEEWIEEWMIKKRDNITVKLVINYGKVE
jgi:predicted site-specific integrase-resolvase